MRMAICDCGLNSPCPNSTPALSYTVTTSPGRAAGSAARTMRWKINGCKVAERSCTHGDCAPGGPAALRATRVRGRPGLKRCFEPRFSMQEIIARRAPTGNPEQSRGVSPRIKRCRPAPKIPVARCFENPRRSLVRESFLAPRLWESPPTSHAVFPPRSPGRAARGKPPHFTRCAVHLGLPATALLLFVFMPRPQCSPRYRQRFQRICLTPVRPDAATATLRHGERGAEQSSPLCQITVTRFPLESQPNCSPRSSSPAVGHRRHSLSSSSEPRIASKSQSASSNAFNSAYDLRPLTPRNSITHGSDGSHPPPRAL